MSKQKINEGGPAFPCSSPLADHVDHGECCGMTLRDYFAAHAPEASMDWLSMWKQRDREANPHNDSYKPKIRSDIELRAEWRYQYADAMIAARKGNRT